MKIRVTNFQSLADVAIDARGLTVLVGQSHRGKSALIRAVEGALFNKLGDYFVREGAKETTVELTDVPDVKGGTHTVTWTKGKGAKYTIDGEPYSKVGASTPPILQQAGYRDLWIGDREKKSGEYLRPQVATQFDPLFLLTRPGAFLADVLHYITRLRVLTVAQDRCAADLRSVRQQLGVSEASVERLKARYASLDGVLDLEDRLAVLRGQVETLQRAKTRYGQLTKLKATREALARVPAMPVTSFESRATVVERLIRLRTLVADRAQLGPVLAPLPSPAAPESMMQLFNQRAQLVQLATRRRQLLTVLATPLPEAPGSVILQTLMMGEEMSAKATALHARQQQALRVVQERSAAATEADTEVFALETELQSSLEDAGLCPLCDQVIAHEHQTESTVESA